MNDWEKDLKIYRLEQAPPKYENYQEYFEKYFAEHDETYLACRIPLRKQIPAILAHE